MATTTVDLVVPTFNEATTLFDNILRLHSYVSTLNECEATIVIVDNGSTDATVSVAERLCTGIPNVKLLCIREKGRGRALRTAWSSSRADVIGYIDADLSPDIYSIGRMLEALISGACHMVIASRLLSGAQVTRSFKRECASRCYNCLRRVLFPSSIRDAQCGLKLITRETAQRVIALTRSHGWFFDTEVLLLAESAGLVVQEIPIRWEESDASRVNILRTAIEEGVGLFALKLRTLQARSRLRKS